MKRVLQVGMVLLVAGVGASGQALRPGGAPKKAQGEMKKGPPAGRLNAPNGAIERLLAMSPEQRERVLEKLPPKQQENLRRRFEQFDQRPPKNGPACSEPGSGWKACHRNGGRC